MPYNSTTPMTQQDLDTMKCSNPDCDHRGMHPDGLVMRSACHPRTPTWVAYQNGLLTVSCSLCHKPVATILVALRPVVPS